MKTQCPYCQAEQDVPDEYCGRELKCAHCNRSWERALPHLRTTNAPPRPLTLPAHHITRRPSPIILYFFAAIGIIGSLLSLFINAIAHEPTTVSYIENAIGLTGASICLFLSLILLALAWVIAAIYENTDSHHRDREKKS